MFEYLIAAALFVVWTLTMLVLGIRFGLELAVDNTRKDGFFEAYDERWVAVPRDSVGDLIELVRKYHA